MGSYLNSQASSTLGSQYSSRSLCCWYRPRTPRRSFDSCVRLGCCRLAPRQESLKGREIPEFRPQFRISKFLNGLLRKCKRKQKQHFRSPEQKTDTTFKDPNTLQNVGKPTSETTFFYHCYVNKMRIFSNPSHLPST